MTTNSVIDLVVSSLQYFAIKQDATVTSQVIEHVAEAMRNAKWTDMTNLLDQGRKEYFNTEEDTKMKPLFGDSD